MISLLLSFLGSSFVGSITGGIAAHFKKKQEIEVRKLELAHDEKKWGHDLQVMQLELTVKKEIAETEAESSMEQARMSAIAAAQLADQVKADEVAAQNAFGKFLLGIVSFTQKMIRPGATITLLSAACVVNFTILAYFPDVLKTANAEAREAYMHGAISWITAQASAVLSYWFVIRTGSSEGKK